MGRIGLPELMIILFIVIIIFGANRLPQLGRGIGSAIKNFKDGIKDETRRPQVIGSPAHSPTRRVTRSRSRYSRRGIANFRVTPKRSLNHRHVDPGVTRPAFSADICSFSDYSASS